MNENFLKWPATKSARDDKADAERHYEAQTSIIRDALSTPNHALNTLINLMKQHGESAVYLCGTRLDNDFGFGSNDLAASLSALPQDGEKAAQPGYHPGSTEVYVVLQGSLVLEFIDNGHLRTKNCGQFDVVLIAPGQCHRVRNEPEREAASFIVKTNPHHKPDAARCEACTHYSDHGACALRASWIAEKQRLGLRE